MSEKLPSGYRYEDRALRKCRECHQPWGKHDPLCSLGFPSKRRYPEREQRKHQQLATPYHAPFFESGEMDDLEMHFADRDDFNPVEEGF